MRNFNIYVSGLYLFIMFIISTFILTYFLEPLSYGHYFKKDIDFISKNNEEVEMIIIGASRTYRTLDPYILENSLNFNNVINAGSSSQPIEGSYYQLESLLDEFTPKYVVLGVTWDQLLETPVSTQGKLIVYDRLNFKSKINYVFDNFLFSELKFLYKPYRFREFFNSNTILTNLKNKINLNLNGFEPQFNEAEFYSYKGFVYSNKSIENGNITIHDTEIFDEKNIDSNKLTYLNKIVSLCKENNVQLYLFSGPTSLMRIYTIKGYEKANDYFQSFAQNNGIIYDNLNLLKGRIDFLPDSLMHDYNHVNGEGAELITSKYSEILKLNFENKDTSMYYYENLDALKEEVNKVISVGCNITYNSNNTTTLNVFSIENVNDFPEYEILVSNDGFNYEILSNYNINDSYTFDSSIINENIYLRINARLIGSNNKFEAFQYY